MRRLLPAGALLALLLTAIFVVWRPFAPDSREALARELSDPDSVWAQALRPEHALADLARFRGAPVYRVSLAYDPDSRSLTGKEEILYANATDRPLRELYLTTFARAWGDAALPADARFHLSPVAVNGKRVAVTQGEHHATVQLSQPVNPGESVTITFDFAAQLPMAPLRQSPTADWTLLENTGTYGITRTLADGLTGVIPTVTEDATWLEHPAQVEGMPAAYSLWDVSVTAPAEYRVISSGVAVSAKPAADGRQTTRILSPSYTFYLFVTSQLRSTSREVDGVRVVVHHREGDKMMGEAVADEVAALLPAHEAVLGPYPYRELEVMPIAYSVGVAAESRAGLVLLTEEAWSNWVGEPPARVTDPWLRSVLRQDLRLARRSILAHELAHAWWGDQAYPDLRKSQWWVEGTTEASAFAALARTEGVDAAEAWLNSRRFNYQILRASGTPDMSAGQAPPDPGQAKAHRLLGYIKPAFFYDQVRRQMGDERFFAAMRQYLARNRFTLTTDRGPVEELMGEPGVEALYRRWVLETHGDEDLGVLTPEQMRQLGMLR